MMHSGPPLDMIAPDLDLVSIDNYYGIGESNRSETDGTVEVEWVRQFAEREMYPRMHPHQ